MGLIDFEKHVQGWRYLIYHPELLIIKIICKGIFQITETHSFTNTFRNVNSLWNTMHMLFSSFVVEIASYPQIFTGKWFDGGSFSDNDHISLPHVDPDMALILVVANVGFLRSGRSRFSLIPSTGQKQRIPGSYTKRWSCKMEETWIVNGGKPPSDMQHTYWTLWWQKKNSIL